MLVHRQNWHGPKCWTHDSGKAYSPGRLALGTPIDSHGNIMEIKHDHESRLDSFGKFNPFPFNSNVVCKSRQLHALAEFCTLTGWSASDEWPQVVLRLLHTYLARPKSTVCGHDMAS